MNYAGFKNDLRYSLWAECANVETGICNLSVSKNCDKNPYERSVFKTNSRFIDNLKVFGEIGVLFNKKKKEEKGKTVENYVFLSVTYRSWKRGASNLQTGNKISCCL